MRSILAIGPAGRANGVIADIMPFQSQKNYQGLLLAHFWQAPHKEKAKEIKESESLSERRRSQ
jgi:peptidase E